MTKKLHWTQTKKGKAILAKRSEKQMAAKSAGEKAVQRAVRVGKQPAPGLARVQFYEEVVRVAIVNNELPKLMAEVREQSLSSLREMMR